MQSSSYDKLQMLRHGWVYSMSRKDWKVLWQGVRLWRREHGELPSLTTNKFAFVVEVLRQRDEKCD